MRRLFVTLVLNTILSGSVFCQFDFKSDKDFKYYDSKISRKLESRAFDEKSNIFELRFWMYKLGTDKEFLLRLKYTTDSIWIAEKYYRRRIFFYRTYKYDITLSNNWQQTWDSLVNFKILEMPSIDTILKQKRKEFFKKDTLKHKEFMTVDFGDSYSIELLTSKNKRSYWYSNPEEYAKFYKDEKGLQMLVKALKILYREFNYKDYGIIR